jgi:hypothetical protein
MNSIGGDKMKRLCCFILLLTLALSLFGCNAVNDKNDEKKAPDVEAGIIGYVMDKQNEGILVVSHEAQDFSSTGGVEAYYNAIWFSNAPKDIRVGDQVKVWYDFVRESYPGQSEIKHIEVVSSSKADGADLTESEALSEALTSPQIKSNGLYAVKSIAYDKQADIWNIEIKEIGEENSYHIQIQDNKQMKLIN